MKIKTAPLFLFPEGQMMHMNQSVYLHFYASFVETVFIMKLNTLVTKYTV